jgi:hypothetical protein
MQKFEEVKGVKCVLSRVEHARIQAVLKKSISAVVEMPLAFLVRFDSRLRFKNGRQLCLEILKSVILVFYKSFLFFL